MSKHVALLYFASGAIEDYCRRYPVEWPSRELANGPGNLMTPTSAMAVFFDLLAKNGRLFTQREYVDYAWTVWSEWKKTLTDTETLGIEARLYRNFYPSAIDSMHVWALLVETRAFAYCSLDTAHDALGKTDLTVVSKDRRVVKVALLSGTAYSKRWTSYKRKARGEVRGTVDIILPMNRPREPGNKRWYRLDDLVPVFKAFELEFEAASAGGFFA